MLSIKLKSHVFVKQYGELPRAPTLEGTSPTNSSVDRPWRILSLFTITCEITLSESHVRVCVCGCVRTCKRETETVK